VKALRALLARIQYKPGWTFEARPSVAGPVPATMLITSHREPDATRREGAPIRVVWTATEWVDDWSEEMLLSWVLENVRAAEDHETREFFWLDGKVFDDPHANGA
jgi:hypothetical protein